jgi:hypothetical protein
MVGSGWCWRPGRFTISTAMGRLTAAHSLSPDWGELIERATPRQRSVFGFPAPGDPYWDEQTLADTQTRYPGADLTPYR